MAFRIGAAAEHPAERQDEATYIAQLKETLDLISKHYENNYERTGYFAAINKGTLFAFAIDGKDTGNFTL